MKTAKRSSWNKGFTLFEMLLVLSVYAVCMSYGMRHLRFDALRYQKWLLISEYAHAQFDAIYYKEHIDFSYDSLTSRYEIHFNGRGNVNMAQTIDFLENEELIITLGCGRIHEP